MTITEFNVRFDQPVYYPGQMITGQVTVCLDKPKDIRGVELKIKGRTKFKWTESESYTDSEGKSQTRYVTREGKETYMKNEIKLMGKTELIIGVHNYPFTAILPHNSPSTFNGTYGGISYYGKAKVDIPLAIDKTTKNYFQVENPLDLNLYPHLKCTAKQEKSKTFCCFCCASGPLTLVAFVPKTGYAKTESIPITVEIDNASNVKVDSVKASLSKKIRWQAQGDSKEEKDKIKRISFGDVPENSSRTWSENMTLDCGPFPNITNCNIINISYKLEVEADPSGVHKDLEVDIPLTIGDVPFCDGETYNPQIPGQLPPNSNYPQVNPAPGGFMPPGAGIGYPNAAGQQNPSVGFNPAAPYPSAPGVNPTPYPNGGTPYPSAPGADPQGPYPPAPGVNPQAPYPGNPQGPYPSTQPTYPSAQYTAGPYPSGEQPQLNAPAGYNPAAGGFTPPVNPAGGNSVAYPPGEGGQNSAFYDPNAGAVDNSGLFSGGPSVTMPTSSFLVNQGGTTAKTPLLPPAPSAPFN